MSAPGRSIAISVDEDAGIIRFYWQPDTSESGCPFKLLQLTFDELFAKQDSEIERAIGRIVLEVLGNTSPETMGRFRQQTAVDDPFMFSALSIIRGKAAAGDADAQNAIGLLLYQRSLEKLDESLLDDADEWLRLASNSGDAEAVEFFLVSWPEMKEQRAQEIKSTVMPRIGQLVEPIIDGFGVAEVIDGMNPDGTPKVIGYVVVNSKREPVGKVMSRTDAIQERARLVRANRPSSPSPF